MGGNLPNNGCFRLHHWSPQRPNFCQRGGAVGLVAGALNREIRIAVFLAHLESLWTQWFHGYMVGICHSFGHKMMHIPWFLGL